MKRFSRKDQIRGALFGVAIGDALGATGEFKHRDDIKAEYGWIPEMIGGGFLNWKPGETTA